MRRLQLEYIGKDRGGVWEWGREGREGGRGKEEGRMGREGREGGEGGKRGRGGREGREGGTEGKEVTKKGKGYRSRMQELFGGTQHDHHSVSHLITTHTHKSTHVHTPTHVHTHVHIHTHTHTRTPTLHGFASGHSPELCSHHDT